MDKVQGPDADRRGLDWTVTSNPDTDDLVSETEDGTDAPSAFLNLHGHATVRGFRLDPTPFVAEGGQGRVFKAECVEEGRLGLHKGEVVALKFVEETDQSPSFEEFEKAVAYLREIKSPHVPRYYGCFRVERRVNGKTKRFRMTVMECLDGADLAYRVKVRSPNFYADEIMYVLDQLLKGLCELAEAGVIHRDIKPSNIFICRDGTVKLIDFDTALIRGIDLCPKNRKIVGTPEFAAPDYLTEGFRGDEISDVFSVGMTLYYMVHGVSPHRAIGTLAGRMDEQCYSSFWRTRKPDCWSKTWWIKERESYCRGSIPLLGLPQVFHMALALDRDLRFTSFEDFRRSLQMVEFVRARHGKKEYVRVISCWECISGAGVGYSCVYGRSERGELHNWGIEGLRLVQPEQMEEKERSALLKIFLGWWNCSDPSLMFGGLHEGCVDIRNLRPLCGRPPLVVTEKFAAENVKVVQTSFAAIKSPEEWRREVEEYEFRMQLS